ncbi:phage protein Gp27 family protein [Thermomonas sp.]|uniref:phage protein Gp27 family protein n=1 Tax=Thermomonas sp. TaxID=1971895 RepID=UPI00260FD82E|nr:phage protein Gp27 family protein [Thermomonas sp.]
MGRKSSIERSPAEVRATIDKLIRQGRLTLDEMRAYVAEAHGEEAVPSRAALGRYTLAQKELVGRMRDIDAAARVVVEELGENADDRAGALLVQSITTLAADAALRAQQPGEKASIEEVRKLARAAKDVIGARKVNRQEREEIARLARERLLAEQKANLDKVARKRGMSAAAREEILKEILGIG